MKHPRRWPHRIRFRHHNRLPDQPGIYAVMTGRKVLYIGLSRNIHQRWNSTGDRRHGRYWLASIRASHIAVMPTKNYVRLERQYIEGYRPPWNDTKYPWFWNSDRGWLGKFGALGWILWAKRNTGRGRWRDAKGLVAIWGGLVLAGIVVVELIGG